MKSYIILLTLFLSLFGCTERDPVIIGFTGGLTGRLSEPSVAARNGAQLAVEMVNKNGGINGRPLKMLIEDDQHDPKIVKENFKKLTELGAVAVIGPILSSVANAAIEAVQENNILAISPTISTPAVAGLDDNFLRTMPVTSIQGEVLARLMQRLGHKKAAIVYENENSAYTVPIVHSFEKTVTYDKEASVVYTRGIHRGATSELPVVAQEIASSGADTLLIVATSLDTAALAQQLFKLNAKVQILGSRWAKTHDLISNGGKTVEGMILETIFERRLKTPEFHTFQQEFLTKFKTEPSFISASGYEAVMLLVEGMRKAKELTPTEVKNSILAIQRFKGIEDDIFIDPFGDAIRSSSLVIIKNGTFEVID